MIESVINFSIQQRKAVIIIIFLAIGLSLYSIVRSPLDAVPDISDPQIIIYSKWQRSPQLLESQITSPIISSLRGLAGVRTVRGVSYLGYSFVYVIIENKSDLKSVRRSVMDNLSAIRNKLPADAEIEVAPDAGAMGWIFQYALSDKDRLYDLRELRLIQENTIKPALESVRGVAEVATIGGLVKQYQLKLYPPLLAETGISLDKVVDALKAAFHEVGGRILEITNRDYQIRGVASFESVDQVESMFVGYSKEGKPVRIRDIGYIQVGYDLRRGIADLDGNGEVVGGILIAGQDENVLELLGKVKRKLAQVSNNLPEGIELVTVYDRSGLLQKTLSSFFKTLAYELLIVVLVMSVFLNSVRSAAPSVLILLLGTVFTSIPVYISGRTLNLFSLAGLFLAMGEMADAAIVMTENCLAEMNIAGKINEKRKRVKIIIKAAAGMGRPLFYSLLIIMVSFLPVFFLEAQEGRLFDPLALSKTFAMFFSTVLTFFFLPGLVLSLSGTKPLPGPGRIYYFMIRIYKPLLKAALKHKYIFIFVNILIMTASLPFFWKFDKAFMPEFEEGSLLYMPTTLPGLPAKEAGWILTRMDKKLKKFPEVKRVFGKLGRADTATDPAPFTMVETTILLHPMEQWRPGMTKDKLIDAMNEEMKLTGFINAWTQPIRARVDMQTTGIQSPVGIKVMGKDLKIIEDISKEIEFLLKDFPGTESIIAERISDGYFIDVKFDYDRLAEHGIPVSDAVLYLKYALGGENVSILNTSAGPVPLNIQYTVDYIDTVEKVKNLMIVTSGGKVVSLSDLASVETVKIPEMIRNENGELTGYIYIDTASVSDSIYVEKASGFLTEKLSLPEGYHIEWSGQFMYQVRVWKRLLIIIPLVMITIVILLAMTFRSFWEAVLIMVSIPFALVGGIWLQMLMGYPLTTAVQIGYIALYGVAAQTGIIMVLFLNRSLKERLEQGETGLEAIETAAVDGAVLRLRPKLMTVSTSILSLLPVMLSSGQGMEIMKPMAVPTMGGMLTSAIHVLFFTPCLFVVIKSVDLKRKK